MSVFWCSTCQTLTVPSNYILCGNCGSVLEYATLQIETQSLPEKAAQILSDNLWDLYEENND